MGMRAALGMGLALSFFTRAALAAKPTHERFGARGQLAIDESFSVMATRSNYGVPELHGLSFTNLRLAPTVSWFVLPQVSLRLGVSLGAGWSTSDATSDGGGYTLLGGSTGLGYALPLGDHFSLWPNASAGLSHFWVDAAEPHPDPGGLVDLSVGASVPVLWHPAPHSSSASAPALSLCVLAGSSAH